jgi:hypothetical protein
MRLGDESAGSAAMRVGGHVNMLDAEHHYTPERAAVAEASLAIPAKLCYALAAQFDTRTGKPD